MNTAAMSAAEQKPPRPRKPRSRWFLTLVGTAILSMLVAPIVLLRSGDADGTDGGAFGAIRGDLVVRLLDDGLRVRVEEELTYTDPMGRVWTVPAGYISDGASIPKSLWSVVGGPFEGRYRVAALFHDIECEKGHWGICQVPSAEIHRMFYNAMRCSGVPDDQARLLWTAVDKFGPKWQASPDAATDHDDFNALNRADSFAVVDVNAGLHQRPIAESPFLVGAKPSGAQPADPDALRQQLEAAPQPAAGAATPIDWSSPVMKRLREAMRRHREAVQRESGRTNGP